MLDSYRKTVSNSFCKTTFCDELISEKIVTGVDVERCKGTQLSENQEQLSQLTSQSDVGDVENFTQGVESRFVPGVTSSASAN